MPQLYIGVSCDSCLKGNFRGRRYKCLVCYDYDLCSVCYEAGATSTRHNADHPMQCILTRVDFELFYGGEALTNIEQPQAYTCPYCSKMGYTDSTLQEHVSSDHADISFEVLCPICVSTPGGDPNLTTDDFAGHLTLEHRSGPRDLISFLDEPVATRVHNVRRITHSGHGGGGGRGVSGRPRRSNMHFSVFTTGGMSSLSPSSRETVDPIAELLSQLSGVRRTTTTNTNSTTPTQLQQLQMQLQLERQQVNATRQQLERIPRRQTPSQTSSKEPTCTVETSNALVLKPAVAVTQTSSTTITTPTFSSKFLLDELLEELSLQSSTEDIRSGRSHFVQQLTLSTMLRRKEKESLFNVPNEYLVSLQKGYIFSSDVDKTEMQDESKIEELVVDEVDEVIENTDIEENI